jgi:hypothetical protein
MVHTHKPADLRDLSPGTTSLETVDTGASLGKKPQELPSIKKKKERKKSNQPK